MVDRSAAEKIAVGFHGSRAGTLSERLVGSNVTQT